MRSCTFCVTARKAESRATHEQIHTRIESGGFAQSRSLIQTGRFADTIAARLYARRASVCAPRVCFVGSLRLSARSSTRHFLGRFGQFLRKFQRRARPSRSLIRRLQLRAPVKPRRARRET
eukprot:6190744-Pleurochrysis_carterae.AAC.1